MMDSEFRSFLLKSNVKKSHFRGWNRRGGEFDAHYPASRGFCMGGVLASTESFASICILRSRLISAYFLERNFLSGR